MKLFFQKKSYLFLLGLLCAIFFVTACEKPKTSQNIQNVLVSIPPYAYVVNKIAGDTVTVHTIVPPGFNPHIFEPKPSQIIQWNPVQTWICIGEGFEKKLYIVLKAQNPQLTILDLSGDATIESEDHHEEDHVHEHGSHCHHHEEKDLHFWLSPKIMQTQSEKIYKMLCKAYPKNSSLYQKNLEKFQGELKEIDTKISQNLENSSYRTILVSHPAFAYFCRDYHLNQLSIEMEGKDPLPHHITKVLETAKKAQIAGVLLQPQYSNKGAEIIAKQLDLQTFEIDPYAYEYLSNLEQLVQTISPIKQ